MITDNKKIIQLLDNTLTAIGHEIITLAADATQYKFNAPAGAKLALCIPEEVGGSGTSKILRFWEDRTDSASPTSTAGIPRGDLEAFEIVGAANIQNFRMVRVTSAAHTVTVQYYG